MKNYLMIALSLLLICTSCQKEDEILPGQSYTNQKEITLRSECFDLATDVWVSGTAKQMSPKSFTAERPLKAAPDRRGIQTYYIIQAEGAGWSEELARSLTSLKLNYWPDSKKLKGTITSVFANGEELEQQINGTAVRDQFDPNALSIELSTASLHTAKDSFNLDQGHLKIILPRLLSGHIEINFSTHGTYCETEAP